MDGHQRLRRLSSQQREAMLSYLKRYPYLMKGRGKNSQYIHQKRGSWSELARTLNAIESGPRKTPERWLKSFQDWRTDIRGKMQKRKSKYGGPTAPLTHYERELIAFLKENSSNGKDPLEPSQEVDLVECKPNIAELDAGLHEESSDSDQPLRTEPDVSYDDLVEEEKEERAVKAMEYQAASLDRLATAVERMADAVTAALNRFASQNNESKQL